MNRRHIVWIAAVSALIAFHGCKDSHQGAHWGYSGEGAPAQWGSLSKEYAFCGTGKNQSPIDISKAVKKNLPAITFTYQDVPLMIENNGHTIKVSTSGGGSITVDGKKYNLVQLHFHEPSEHTVNGKAAAMVVHLVHQSDDGKLAVVGVLMEKGAENPLIKSIWNVLPMTVGKPEVHSVRISASKLLPVKHTYYSYEGSLTTPPCSEGVKWMVLKQPLTVSAAQIEKYRSLYPGSVRPVQPLNGRVVYSN
ncbi:MAG: carbonate dehydratase [Nitrospirae bacterium GWC2_57_13]|jgi:carbonic anhydrase|nr:MAG: carbonate dehydratase [Nitrospirae bacterium GWC1_57_7]OGW29145.1 MAG: carbonate dehydratase [Nitrospirae bacterium GWC2_57_13]HAR45137.1 carbonate dehydratase [Nitrospiraceae bacterium]HAS52853.1 carbonate dehydratase [Nitrospiraceae bacterium]